MNSNSATVQGISPRRLSGNGAGPFGILASTWTHRELVLRLTRREIESRYRGSILGFFWVFLIPLVMLGVYTFVFKGIFKAHWEGTDAPFFLILFAGLIFCNVFSECLGRAPTLILGNVPYIKRVVFPLDILPVVAMAASLFDAVISLAILFAVYLPVVGIPSATALLLPLVALPLIVMTLGLVWFVAALGVYVRDLRHVMMAILMAVPFLCPLFFPFTVFGNFGAWLANLIKLNPLTIPLIQLRQILFFNQSPNWFQWAIYSLTAWLIAYAGLTWFRFAQRGFADVV